MMWLEKAMETDIGITIGMADHPLILDARRLHARTYADKGFIDNASNWIDLDNGLIQDRFVDSSIYLAARFMDQVVGVARLIPPRPNGLPVFQHFELDADLALPSQDECIEISSLVIDRQSKVYSAVFLHLARAFTAISYTRPERYCVAVVERPLLRVMNRFYGFDFKQMGAPRQYLGGVTLPVLLDVPAYLEGLWGAHRRFMHDTTSIDDTRVVGALVGTTNDTNPSSM